MGMMARLYLRRIAYLVGGCVLVTALITLLPQPPGNAAGSRKESGFQASLSEKFRTTGKSLNSESCLARASECGTNGTRQKERSLWKSRSNTKDAAAAAAAPGSTWDVQKPAPLAFAARKLADKSGNSEHQQYEEMLPFKQLAVGDVDKVKHELESWSFDEREVDEELVKELEEYWTQVKDKQASECTHNITLADHWKKAHGSYYSDRPPSEWDSYEVFYNAIDSCALYEREDVVQNLLNDVHKWPVKHVAIMDGGTQVKLLITFENGHKALWKPMRFGRYYESDENHFYFSDFERSVAEIGAYHLDKVLGYRRAIPTVGRIFNLSSEIRPFAERALNKTFFWSPAKNLCFVSKCDYYCDTTHAICGRPHMKEGSLQVFLPNDDNVPRKHTRSIYRRTYSKKDQLAVWQKDQSYCSWKVKRKTYYARGRRLLDLIDMHILDFLMGNQDRHHFESFTVFDNRVVYPLHMDNGRGFGRSDYDDLSILYPLSQCCLIRPSTYRRLLSYYAGKPESLTQAFHESLAHDPTAPLFPVKHYVALERRLTTIMQTLDECIHKTGDVNRVVMPRYDNPEVVGQPAPDSADQSEQDDDGGDTTKRKPKKNTK